MTIPPTAQPTPEIERAKQLFRFLKAYSERTTPVVRDISYQPWTLSLRNLPKHPAIVMGEVRLDGAAQPGSNAPLADDEPLLRVSRPNLTRPPDPPRIVLDYLRTGWEHSAGTIDVAETRNITSRGQTVVERFVDDPSRVQALADWRNRWGLWAFAERPALEAMRLFERLYGLHGQIERESEQVELLIGDGRLRWRQPEYLVDHPVLLQRVELEFDPSVPEFRIVDADRGPELYTAVLVGGEGITAAQLNRLRIELEEGEYHPLARDATAGFLRRLIQSLAARGVFRESLPNEAIGTTPTLVRDPVLFLRKRTGGYAAAFERVLEDLENRQDIPPGLSRVVGIEPPLPADHIEQNDSPWSEPPDVLLSKPANAEQIQIARALERHKAVLVQGPPGTGKSHTIANLIGHLVAKGKRVLVTSHTTKALRVLRDQVVGPLQPLCVAVLENDLAGRQQMEQAVRGILARLTSASDEGLSKEVVRFTDQRVKLNNEIGVLTSNLRAAREAEYLPIVVDNLSLEPSEAARWMVQNSKGNDWIPGPTEGGAPLPLSGTEANELYASNGAIAKVEEDELDGRLPDASDIVEPAQFLQLTKNLLESEPPELRKFWHRNPTEDDGPRLAGLNTLVNSASQDLLLLRPWQRTLVAAGHSGGSEQDLWIDLARQVNVAAQAWEQSRALLLDNEVTISSRHESPSLRRLVSEIGTHLNNGGSLGGLRLLVSPGWKSVIETCRVNGTEPKTIAHFKAISAHIALEEGRGKLSGRWKRQAEPAGLPQYVDLGSPPEPILREYAAQFDSLLSWWRRRWPEVENSFADSGFRWLQFRSAEVAKSGPTKPFERDVAILSGPLANAIGTRLAAITRITAERILANLQRNVSSKRGPVCSALALATKNLDASRYTVAWESLEYLRTLIPAWTKRNSLLSRVGSCAGAWETAIRKRDGVHAAASTPGDPSVAWRWRQLRQEIDRRSALDESVLTRQLDRQRDALRFTTAELIDRLAWLGQLRRVNLSARQALQGWADIQKKIGKGTGKRVPVLQAEARRLLTKARGSVPVWIMPLSRVAESFDATQGKFDVVIVDEASQSDVTGLLAWYLGDSIAVVGDHEQVSPLAVGQQVQVMQELIAEHLVGIPNNQLYDGTTSVYDLARQSFGGTIALREHFRCVPDIIEFSNELSYNLEIRPLRDPATAPMPHVVEYMVQPELGAERHGKTNLAEARSVVALVKAITEMPEYGGKTIGAITLLGDEQAGLIQDLAVSLVGAIELEGRRFVAGNSAQFQGDERHVIFLSMVDTPTGIPLRLSQTEAFKQRYNVAASRAKDQLWLVHSLDPNRDLKAGDLRRRLIEYVRDPAARRTARESATRRAESPFEIAVIERLITAGYQVTPQVEVGRYRIDMIVSDGTKRVALECDGDRFHGVDQIPLDMVRQAILERAGWRFLRIRGTRFFRDPDGTMEWVFGELRRLGIDPSGTAPTAASLDENAKLFRDKVVRRAWEIMREEKWVIEQAADLPTALSSDLL